LCCNRCATVKTRIAIVSNRIGLQQKEPGSRSTVEPAQVLRAGDARVIARTMLIAQCSVYRTVSAVLDNRQAEFEFRPLALFRLCGGLAMVHLHDSAGRIEPDSCALSLFQAWLIKSRESAEQL
jgi:hypothetical protein